MAKAGDWFKGLSVGGKVGAVAGAGIALLTTIGIVGAVASPPKTPTPQPPTQPPVSAPKVETKIVETKSAVEFTNEDQNNGTLAKGTTKILREGVVGERTITYEVTYTDGNETARREVSNTVTTAPVNRLVAIGTYVAPPPPPPAPVASPSCDPNYSGACVPIASDVDCAGGSGNGPAYVRGPVKVIGTDIYDLDRDGNGYGCE